MAVATQGSKLASSTKTDVFLSGDASTEKALGWVDMQDFSSILITAINASGGGATTFKIWASEVAAGTNPVEIKVHPLGTPPATPGFWVYLEALSEELKAAGQNLRYVSAAVTNGAGADNTVCTYLREGRHCKENLTVEKLS